MSSPGSSPQPEVGAGPSILLVSPDLLSTSRLAGLTRQEGGRLETLRSLDGELPGASYDLVLLDLQPLADDPAVIVTRLKARLEALRTASGRPVPLVAFGPHVAHERLEQAVAAGADAAVSRGELLGGFPAILRRFRS